jgi:hypothetical protein
MSQIKIEEAVNMHNANKEKPDHINEGDVAVFCFPDKAEGYAKKMLSQIKTGKKKFDAKFVKDVVSFTGVDANFIFGIELQTIIK